MILKHENGRVTFVFDQSSTFPVFLTGDFSKWSTADMEPMDLIDNKWQKTVKLKPGAYQFKYFTIEPDGIHWYNDWRADAYTKSPFGGENSVVIIE
jgi:1,4-alpha-glucan branching enzyme